MVLPQRFPRLEHAMLSRRRVFAVERLGGRGESRCLPPWGRLLFSSPARAASTSRTPSLPCFEGVECIRLGTPYIVQILQDLQVNHPPPTSYWSGPPFPPIPVVEASSIRGWVTPISLPQPAALQAPWWPQTHFSGLVAGHRLPGTLLDPERTGWHPLPAKAAQASARFQ